jgi:anti-sigma B factor antagonist
VGSEKVRGGGWMMELRDEQEPAAAEVTVLPDGDAVRLEVRGQLDMSTAWMLDRDLRFAEAFAPRALRVDVSRVTFIGVAGLRVLVAAANRAWHTGAELRLLAPSQPVWRLLAALGEYQIRGLAIETPAAAR